MIVENDPQVTNLSSDIAARTAGIPVLQGSVRLPWGVPVVEGPVEESVFISFDLGEPATPEGNLSPDVDMGGHGAVGLTAPAREMVTHFFETGEVYAPCAPDCTLAP